VLPEVVSRLQQVPDAAQRRRWLTALSALMSEEEMIAMGDWISAQDWDTFREIVRSSCVFRALPNAPDRMRA
jgi:hypothetical protein